ncbi:MAG: tryptophan--tRNA ligase [Omnitrophica WOR_2 bacterium SM23_72]|nr:MAG: tryptophan--tRNA ligase [Omnitrophica WOR_2 bacterium SM23_72]
MKKRILSGMRPTGKLHLGHLVGALDNWVKLQEDYHCFFMVADWHALMSEYENTQDLKENTLDNVVDWLACGLDPKKVTLFKQSEVPEHLELYIIFSIVTPLGLLERCPTYKEQLRELTNRNLHTFGFLGYPVLQAADILVYKAEVVPVGEDQLPHLELTRQIARKFNHLYKKDYFSEPQALLTKTQRLLGLDGRKMSKSYNNFIALSEEPSVIRKKVANMFTDPQRIRFSDPGHPDKCNVHHYYAVFAPERKKKVDELCRRAQIGCTDCKKELAERLIKVLEPIQKKRNELLKDRSEIFKILEEGRGTAQSVARKTLTEVKKLINL